MMRFAFITSLQELESIYKTNKDTVIYKVSKDEFDKLEENTYVILGFCELGNIYAKVKTKSIQPRNLFKADEVNYFIIFEILVESKLELIVPIGEYCKEGMDNLEDE